MKLTIETNINVFDSNSIRLIDNPFQHDFEYKIIEERITIIPKNTTGLVIQLPGVNLNFLHITTDKPLKVKLDTRDYILFDNIFLSDCAYSLLYLTNESLIDDANIRMIFGIKP